MNKILCYKLMFLWFFLSCSQQPYKAILEQSPQTISTLDSVPKVLIAHLKANAVARDGFDIADTDEEYNPYDVYDSDNPIPSRKFVTAYHRKKEWIMVYHKGGRAHSTFILFATIKGDNVIDLRILTIKRTKEIPVFVSIEDINLILKSENYLEYYNNGKPLAIRRGEW